MIKTLIVPCATKNTNVEFAYNKDTYSINCVNAIKGINLKEFDEIWYIILDDMDNKYHISAKIKTDIRRMFPLLSNKVHFCALPEMTVSPAETVYKALMLLKRSGDKKRSIMIKDADNTCNIKQEMSGNSVLVASLEDMDIVDPMHKSYVKLDEQGFITNIIEKRVLSDRFVAGGYLFDDMDDYISAYEKLNNDNESFYISDIIFWLILNTNIQFRPIEAMNFIDFNLNK